MSEFLSGLISSSLAIYLTQPIDTLKIQYQISKTNNNTIKSIIQNIYHKQGLFGFYKGTTSMLSTYPIFWSIFFEFKNKKFEFFKNKHTNNVANTIIASSVASAVANPLFVLKTRKQTAITKGIYNINYFHLNNIIKIHFIFVCYYF
jgi:solute carrier family 25 protein 38